ncbi:MAG: hypothetical protein ACLFPN_03205 [Methanomassiliicoccales archaeon]
MTSKLYIMLRSPEEHCDLEVIERLSGEEGRAAMLFEDAVYFSVMEKRGKNLLDRVDRAYVISDDLRSGGSPPTSWRALRRWTTPRRST